LIVAVGVRTHSNDVDVDSVTANGVAMTKQIDTSDGDTCKINIWTLAEPPTDNVEIVVTLSSGTRYWCANSIMMYGISAGGVSSSDDGTGTSMSTTTASVTPDAMVLCVVMQNGEVTSATPITGAIVLIPPLASSGGAPTDENCSIAVSYQRGVAGGDIVSTYDTDVSALYLIQAYEFDRIPLEAYATIEFDMAASSSNSRLVKGSVLGQADRTIDDLTNRVKALEERTEHVRRGTWGR